MEQGWDFLPRDGLDPVGELNAAGRAADDEAVASGFVLIEKHLNVFGVGRLWGVAPLHFDRDVVFACG